MVDPTKGDIFGTVGAKLGNSTLLVENALVALEGTSYMANTDSHGEFHFNDIEPGDYNLTASADNFAFTNQTVSVVAGESSNLGRVDLDLVCSFDTGSIFGQVLSTAGNANLLIGGATVTLQDEEGNMLFSDVTSADGAFSFNDVPEGNYRLTIEADSFQSTTKNVTVQPGENVSLPESMTQIGIECNQVIPGDATGDGKISLDDVVYDLRIITSEID